MSSTIRFADIHQYEIQSKIGEGMFGKLFRVKDLQTGSYYAAEVLRNIVDEEAKDSPELLHLFRQINLMPLFNHPAIIKFIGYSPIDFEDEPHPTIIAEFLMNGTLLDMIEKEVSGLLPDDWNDTKKLINIYGIASGMSYLHSHGILHRNLNPSSILLDEYLHPKISDFSLLVLEDSTINDLSIQTQEGLVGTPSYLAPETFRENKYSKSGDVYAFALTVYEILTGNKWFENINIYELIKKLFIEGRPLRHSKMACHFFIIGVFFLMKVAYSLKCDIKTI